MRNIIVCILFALNFISLISMDKPEKKQLIVPKKQTSFLKITKPKKPVRKKNSQAPISTPNGVWKYLIKNIRSYLSDEEIDPFVRTLYRANKRLHHHALLYYVPSPCDSDSDLTNDSENDTPIGICNQMQIAIRCRSALAIRLCLNDPQIAKTNHDLDEALKFAQEINDNSLIKLLIEAGATSTVSNKKP